MFMVFKCVLMVCIPTMQRDPKSCAILNSEYVPWYVQWPFILHWIVCGNIFQSTTTKVLPQHLPWDCPNFPVETRSFPTSTRFEIRPSVGWRESSIFFLRRAKSMTSNNDQQKKQQHPVKSMHWGYQWTRLVINSSRYKWWCTGQIHPLVPIMMWEATALLIYGCVYTYLYIYIYIIYIIYYIYIYIYIIYILYILYIYIYYIYIVSVNK